MRRKFDGLKYALRRLEDVLYEQSLVGRGDGDDGAAPEAPEAPEAPRWLASLAAVKERMDASDAAREPSRPRPWPPRRGRPRSTKWYT